MIELTTKQYNVIRQIQSLDIDDESNLPALLEAIGLDSQFLLENTTIPDGVRTKNWDKALLNNHMVTEAISIEQYNDQIRMSLSLKEGYKIFKKIKEDKNVKHNIDTYNALMSIASTFKQCNSCYKCAVSDIQVEPDIVTYNTLLKMSPTFDAFENVFLQLINKDNNVHPNLDTIHELVARADRPDELKILFTYISGDSSLESQFWKESVPVLTSNFDASRLLSYAYSISKIHNAHSFNHALNEAIEVYRQAGRLSEALQISIVFPYFKNSKKLIKEERNAALSFFEAQIEADNDDASYALAVFYYIWSDFHNFSILSSQVRNSMNVPKDRIIHLDEMENELSKTSG